MSVLTFTSNSPDDSTITIVNGSTSTGYSLNDSGPDFGSINWNPNYAGSRGTQGSRPGNAYPDNRVVTIPIRIIGTSKDNMAVKLQALNRVVDDMRRFGGTILWKSSNQTYRQSFNALTASIAGSQWIQRTETSNIMEVVCGFSCSPLALGDPMDTYDGFDTNTLATDYTVDSNVAAVTVSGGLLVPATVGASAFRARHTLKGYHPRDVQVTLRINTGTSITSGVWGVGARFDTAGADTGLLVELVAGTNVIRLRKVIAGSLTTLGSTGAITPAVSSSYWLRFRTEGNVLFGEVFTSDPGSAMQGNNAPNVTPAQNVSYAMTLAEAARFFDGHPAIRLTTASTITTESYDDFRYEPLTYRLPLVPEELVLGDSIPGDSPALADIFISPLGGPASGDAGTTPIWGSAAWYERPQIYNLCWNGDFDDTTIAVSGWTNAAVTNVQASASTSVARDTTAADIKYGTATMKITCPATTNTGANFPVYHRAKKGRTYAIFMWVTGSLTTNSSLFLGFNDGADIAVESATALVTTGPKLRVLTWTPTADRDQFWAGIKITAATATNMFVDGVNILEIPTVAISANISSTSAATLTVYNNPTDLPKTPFNAIIGTELIRVTDASTTTWAIVRGQELTTAATHTADDAVIIVPPSLRQYQGKGAVPPVGIIEGESYVPALSSASTGALSVTADTAGRGGNKLRWSAGASGSATAEFFVDPSLIVPDDYATGYTGGEVDIEVWARVEMASALASPSIVLSCLPEGGTTTGATRYTREYGTAVKPLTLPSSQNYRYVHLGTIPMFVDRSNPLRWILKIALNQTSSGTQFNIDYLVLNLSRFRLCSITGKANDSNFPQFIPDAGSAWSNTSTMTKALKADGTAYINEAGKPSYPDNGLGRTIEIPEGIANSVIKLSNRIPDDTTASVDRADMDDDAGSAIGTTACYTSTVHFAITPRYAIVRGS